MNILEINKAIMFGTWSNDELTSIGDAVKWNRAQLGKQTKRSMTLGCTVRFTHPKTGRLHTGIVKKIKIKNITVLENGTMNWNVPANMLEVA
jgi:hypothetical protein